MFKAGGKTVVSALESGLRHFQIVGFNPTKAELEEKGFNVKEEPKRVDQWSVPFLLDGKTVTVTENTRKQVENYCIRVTGQNLSSLYEVIELPKETKLQAQLIMVEVLLESDGKYFRKMFRWFNDRRVVPMTYQKKETPTEPMIAWPEISYRRKMFDPQLNVRMFENGKALSEQNMVYPAAAFQPAPASYARFDTGKGGIGDFLDFANLVRAYMRTLNLTVETPDKKTVSAFDPSIDLFGALGGENLIAGDVSIVNNLVLTMNKERESKFRGFIGYLGVAFRPFKDMLNKNSVVAELYNKVVFNTNNTIKLDPPTAKQIADKVTGMGVYTVPGITKCRELSPDEINEMQMHFYNDNPYLIKSKQDKPAKSNNAKGSKAGGSSSYTPYGGSSAAAPSEDVVDDGNDWLAD